MNHADQYRELMAPLYIDPPEPPPAPAPPRPAPRPVPVAAPAPGPNWAALLRHPIVLLLIATLVLLLAFQLSH